MAVNKYREFMKMHSVGLYVAGKGTLYILDFNRTCQDYWELEDSEIYRTCRRMHYMQCVEEFSRAKTNMTMLSMEHLWLDLLEGTLKSIDQGKSISHAFVEAAALGLMIDCAYKNVVVSKIDEEIHVYDVHGSIENVFSTIDDGLLKGFFAI